MQINNIIRNNVKFSAYKPSSNGKVKTTNPIETQPKFANSLECLESNGRYVSGRKNSPQIRFNFRTLEEATEYFKQEYGINSYFTNLMQARKVKAVIDKFIMLPGIKDKKFLEGISIKCVANPNPNIADSKIAINANFAYQYTLNEEESEIYEKYCAEGRENEVKEKFKYAINNINLTDINILFSDKISDEKELSQKITKAIAKLICLKHYPREYIIGADTKLSGEELKIVRKSGLDEAETKNEFKSDFITGKLDGQTFDKDAVNLYRKLDGPNIFGDWNDDEPIFKNIEDASKYFLQEYGIVASFDNIEQAGAFKNVLERFIALPSIDNKRFLEGVEICTTDSIQSVWNSDQQASADTQTTYHSNKNKIKIDKQKIRLNSNAPFKWDSAPVSKSRNAELSQNAIAHEIGHVLHILHSPNIFIFKNSDTPNEQESKIMKRVSRYADKNRNEFAAEYIANRLLGTTYDKEVIQLYKETGAPDLFEEF